MKKHLLLSAIVLFCFIAKANAQDSMCYEPRLILDFPVLDFPHMNYATGMTYNKRLGNLSGNSVHPGFTDFIRSYESPSMQQAMAVTKNLHATNYYFNNRL